MHQAAGILILGFVMVSLFIGSAVRNLLKGSSVPYTVALLVIGLGLGLLQRSDVLQQQLPAVSAALDLVSSIEPHLILFLFLPTLIFESVFAMEVHLFRRIFSQITILAVPGMLLAATATAVLARYLFPWDWSWPLCFMFGAMVSATDPVAVVALLKEVSSRKRLETLLEGESLLNDGTAIVLFTLFYGLLVTEGSPDVSVLVVSGSFFWVILLGMSIGILVGGLAILWIGRVFNDPIIEISLSIASAYLVFLLAENVLHVSGVVALVTLALLFAGVGRTRISPEVSGFLSHFWEMMAHIANTIIFLLVGIIIASRVPLHNLELWSTLFMLYIGVQLIRALALWLCLPVLKRVGIGITREKAIVLTWGGLRGAGFPGAGIDRCPGCDSAILAGRSDAVPLRRSRGIDHPDQWYNHGGCVGLAETGPIAAGQKGYRRAGAPAGARGTKQIAARVAWQRISAGSRLAAGTGAGEPAGTWFRCYRSGSQRSQTVDFRRRLLEAERCNYWQQFEEGILGRSATNHLLEAVEHALDGEPQIHPRADLQRLWRMPGIIKFLRRLPSFNRLLISLTFARLVLGYDTARGFIKAQDEVERYIDDLAPTREEAEAVRREVLLNKREAYEYVEQIRLTFPEIICALETTAASRILLNHERKVIQDLLNSAVLEKSEAERMLADVESRMAQLQKLPVRMPRPNPGQLISRSKLFQGLARSTLDALQEEASQQLYGAGDTIIQQGDASTALGIVVRGAVEVLSERNGGERVVNVLGPPAVIALQALQTGISNVTCRAITPAAIIWLEYSRLKTIMARDAMLAERLEQLLKGYVKPGGTAGC